MLTSLYASTTFSGAIFSAYKRCHIFLSGSSSSTCLDSIVFTSTRKYPSRILVQANLSIFLL
ncbi:ORF242 [White spot syndrome virus]|uniref:ORF242 n=1 Tax=White spot syndrome virus TaxID=342409 RepID=A0A2D3I729_9VIRU|nr:ORF242 [White spot syndrome virus]